MKKTFLFIALLSFAFASAAQQPNSDRGGAAAPPQSQQDQQMQMQMQQMQQMESRMQAMRALMERISEHEGSRRAAAPAGRVTVPPDSSHWRCGRANISRDTRSKHGGRFSLQRSMRPDVVVVSAPALDA